MEHEPMVWECDDRTWTAACDCGWESTDHESEREAWRAVEHHDRSL